MLFRSRCHYDFRPLLFSFINLLLQVLKPFLRTQLIGREPFQSHIFFLISHRPTAIYFFLGAPFADVQSMGVLILVIDGQQGLVEVLGWVLHEGVFDLEADIVGELLGQLG